MQSIYESKPLDNKGKRFDLEPYRGKPLLIVNTASKCGFTPQYKGLEQLWQAYKDQGLVVLGFPCDQFAHQEPGDDQAIEQFCQLNFGVSFPLMSKVEVNGPNEDPVFAFLKRRSKSWFGRGVKWNFTKFLVMPDGQTVKRFAPTTEPEALRPEIEKALAR